MCAVAFGGLMLGGCGSSRSSVKGSQGRVVKNERRHGGGGSRKPATQPRPVNLADIDDPMARDLIAEANGWLGTPYSYGGATTGGVDCSGLVMSLYRDVTGMKLPRTTREQVRYCTNLARNKIRPGDLVFFANGSDVSHVGLYVGNGSMIHASSSRGVVVSDIDNGYWADRYLTGGRVESAREAWAALNRPRRGKGKPAKEVPAPAESPAQLIYDQGEMAAAKSPASTPPPAQAPALTPPDRQAPSVAASEIGSLLAASATPAQASRTDAPKEPVNEIDLLDRIITEKTDSIFSSQFLD